MKSRLTQRENWRSKNRQKVIDMGEFVGLYVPKEEPKKVEPKPEVKEVKAEKKTPKKKTK